MQESVLSIPKNRHQRNKRMERTWEKLPHVITPTLKRRILRDWHSHFLNWGKRKGYLGFEYLVGPLCVSIGFDARGGKNHYDVGFSVHNLSRERDGFYATLLEYLRTTYTGAPDSLAMRWHDKNYSEAAERMKQQMILPYTSPITLSQVIEAYHSYIAQGKSCSGPTLINELADPPMLASWAGDLDRAQECLDWSFNYLKKRPKEDHPAEGLEAWYANIQKLIQDPESLRVTARSEVEKFGLQKIPSCCFSDCPYQEPLTKKPFEELSE